jgi:hypothetical protein
MAVRSGRTFRVTGLIGGDKSGGGAPHMLHVLDPAILEFHAEKEDLRRAIEISGTFPDDDLIILIDHR